MTEHDPRPLAPTSEKGGRLPDFVIVGAAKAGSTSLHGYLSAHPDVFMPPEKEVWFFDALYDRGVDWYRSRFEGASGQRLVGEASPEYMLQAEAPARMAEVIPDAKLIAILRHPVDRAYSNHWHWVRNWGVTGRARSFERIVREEMASPKTEPTAGPWPEPRPLLGMGRYLPQLERICRHYPRERLLVLLFDDLLDDPAGLFDRLCGFLGIDGSVVPPDVGRAFNPASRLRSEAVRRLMLRWHLYRRLPGRVTRTIDRLNRTRAPYPPMAPGLRRELIDWFQEDNEALAAWLGRDLPAWER